MYSHHCSTCHPGSPLRYIHTLSDDVVRERGSGVPGARQAVDEGGEGEAEVRNKLEELEAKAHDRAAEGAKVGRRRRHVAITLSSQTDVTKSNHHIKAPAPHLSRL